MLPSLNCTAKILAGHILQLASLTTAGMKVLVLDQVPLQCFRMRQIKRSQILAQTISSQSIACALAKKV